MSDRYIDFANSPIGRRMVGSSACHRRYAWNAGRPGACGRSKAHCYWAAGR